MSRALAVLEVAVRTRPTGEDALRAHYDARAKMPDTKGFGPLPGHAARAVIAAAGAMLPGTDDTESMAALVAARASAVEAVMAATGVDSGVATRLAAARAYTDALARCVAAECPTPLTDALDRCKVSG